jgi:beta-lactamase class A
MTRHNKLSSVSQARRAFLAGVAATTVAVPFSIRAAAQEQLLSPSKIGSLFAKLPGTKAFKVWAPAVDGKPEFRAASNASTMLFVGSAIKTFILCEALRQADAPNVVQTLSEKHLALDASVWSIDSQTLNPPNLTGLVSERTALEAMIMHSDNTATDMSLKLVGPDNVRAFIASAGLKNTLIPDSTRIFFGYLLGAKDYKTFTWDELVAALEAGQPIVNPPLNTVETLASSADDLISYYSRALQGAFFKSPETLTELRRILSVGDVIYRVPLPLGVSAYVKGGSIDVPGFHCLCVPGAMFFSDRWLYFAFIINWNAAAQTDPETVSAFASAVSQALGLVKDRLSA